MADCAWEVEIDPITRGPEKGTGVRTSLTDRNTGMISIHAYQCGSHVQLELSPVETRLLANALAALAVEAAKETAP